MAGGGGEREMECVSQCSITMAFFIIHSHTQTQPSYTTPSSNSTPKSWQRAETREFLMGNLRTRWQRYGYKLIYIMEQQDDRVLSWTNTLYRYLLIVSKQNICMRVSLCWFVYGGNWSMCNKFHCFTLLSLATTPYTRRPTFWRPPTFIRIWNAFRKPGKCVVFRAQEQSNFRNVLKGCTRNIYNCCKFDV